MNNNDVRDRRWNGIEKQNGFKKNAMRKTEWNN